MTGLIAYYNALLVNISLSEFSLYTAYSYRLKAYFAHCPFRLFIKRIDIFYILF